MEIKFESVLERDIDLYIMNKFATDDKFKNLFLNNTIYCDYKVKEIVHSLTDDTGENDITIVLEKEKSKVAIFIEDKINANFMKDQLKRYKDRKRTAKSNKDYDDVMIFLVAPKSYIEGHFDNNLDGINIVSYERLLEYIEGDLYGEALLKCAIKKKEEKSNLPENKNVTLFWKRYYDYLDQINYELPINKIDGQRSSKSLWPIFHTIPKRKGVTIVHKSYLGNVDLEFAGLADYRDEIYKLFNPKELRLKKYIIEPTDKSLVLRANVKEVDFNGSFDEQKELISKALEKAEDLNRLFNEIDINKFIDIQEKSKKK